MSGYGINDYEYRNGQLQVKQMTVYPGECRCPMCSPMVLQETKPKKTMASKLNSMMKRLLDADTQALVKSGIINGDLELTSEGKAELWTILFDANKAALVARAKEIIAEEEKAK